MTPVDRTLRWRGREWDPWELYELSVQCPPIEAAFLRALHRGDPRVLGEDFAGAAGVSRAWVRLDAGFEAVATDRDAAPLRVAVRLLTERAPEATPRLTVRERDVLEVGDRADVIAGLNFAACELHERKRLVTYFRHVLYRLNAGGVAVFDTYGGADAMAPGVSRQQIDVDGGVLVYLWEQVSADAATGRVRNAIHYEAPLGDGDHHAVGARLDEAFVYDWRLWSVPELRDAMRDAGFRSTEVHASYGGALDGDGGVLLHPPASTDEPGVASDASSMPEPDESAVFYVVGRA